jgi:hypothetical protein
MNISACYFVLALKFSVLYFREKVLSIRYPYKMSKAIFAMPDCDRVVTMD